MNLPEIALLQSLEPYGTYMYYRDKAISYWFSDPKGVVTIDKKVGGFCYNNSMLPSCFMLLLPTAAIPPENTWKNLSINFVFALNVFT